MEIQSKEKQFSPSFRRPSVNAKRNGINEPRKADKKSIGEVKWGTQHELLMKIEREEEEMRRKVTIV